MTEQQAIDLVAQRAEEISSMEFLKPTLTNLFQIGGAEAVKEFCYNAAIATLYGMK